MGEYRSDGEGLTGIARELVSAYLDAATDCDAEYAAEEIDEFLLDRDWLPGEALVVLLDLPLRAQTSALQIEALEAALAAEAREPATRGDRGPTGAEDEGDGRR